MRGKVGSEAKSLEPSPMLGHADSKIAERMYHRKPERVRPLQ